jgi:DNA-directed RNA polymerase specialized sigma24 family protein
MRNDDFDLDVTTGVSADDDLVAALDVAVLATAISELPSDLREPMTAVLIDGRTYSDVSQELGIRQAELVRALQRGRRLIARRVRAEQ